MSSFTLYQDAIAVNTESFPFGSHSVQGDLLVVLWAAGTSGGGNPTLPTSLSDNNGNVYDLVSFTTPGSPSQATLGLYVAIQIAVSPNNPITLSATGETGVPSGGPSWIGAEFSVPAGYQIFGWQVCGGSPPYSSTTQDAMLLLAGQSSGVGTNPQMITISNSDEVVHGQVGLLLVNPGVDCLAIIGDYDYNSGSGTWTTSGTLIGSTIESGGRTAALAMQAFSMASSACGYLPPRPPPGAPFIVQSVHLTEVNRIKSYRVSCIAGATIGSWLTALKYSVDGS